MWDLRNRSTAYATPGISSSAAPCEYGQATAGGSPRGGGFLGEPRLSLDISEGSDVKSVPGVLALSAKRVGAEEEESVKGEGGVV